MVITLEKSWGDSCSLDPHRDIIPISRVPVNHDYRDSQSLKWHCVQGLALTFFYPFFFFCSILGICFDKSFHIALLRSSD